MIPAPLRQPAFRWFFAGRTMSFLGSSMVPVALAFAVLDLSNSAAALGIVLAARSIPQVAFMLLGGVISDRVSRSTVMVVSNALSGVSQCLAATLLITGNAEVWSLAAIEAVNGTVAAFTFPAMTSVVPMVVERDQLQQSNALLNFTRNGTFIAGPSIAAGIVVTVGSGWAIAVDGISFLISAVCMSRLHLPRMARAEATSIIHDLREGWTAFVGRTWVWVIVAVFGVMNMVHAGVMFTLGPVIAKDTFGEGGWGLILSAEAVGFFLMTLVLTKATLRFPLRAGMIGMVALGLPMLVLGIAPEVVPLVALSFLGGAGVEVFDIGWSTALQEQIPLEVLSRVSSYDALGSFIAIPIGQLLAGPLAQAFGERDVAIAGAVVYFVCVALALASRSVRNLERLPAGAAPPT